MTMTPPGPPLNLPSYLSWSKYIRNILIKFAYDVGTSLLRVQTYGRKLNSRKITIPTAETGNCTVLVFEPSHRLPNRKGIILNLHGGGWTIGKPKLDSHLSQYMADECNMTVVAPDYRKGPRYPFPHALYQMYSVLSWIAEGNLPSHPTPKLHLLGSSAGGNLCAALCLMCSRSPLPNQRLIQSQTLICPVLDLTASRDVKRDRLPHPDRTPRWPAWFIDFFNTSYYPTPTDPSEPLISPLLAAPEELKKSPRTLVATAELDTLFWEGEEYAKTLKGLGVQARWERFEDVGHCFDGPRPLQINEEMAKINQRQRKALYEMIRDFVTQE